uniref:Uncharacterized protein n=1 Tax=Mycena chlorophos TaxID=658473 RepID=A0ABQ0LBY8_MYCCL|nr:predicted protein [Mycena chlorophos]
MATTLMRRPMPVEQPPSRAAQRRQRLLEMENEQRLEELEGLKMTEEQRLILFHSFRSVKFEWSDLDGMRYVRRRYNSPPVQPPSRARSPATAPSSPRPPPLQLHPPSPPPRPQSAEALQTVTNRQTSPPALAPISVPFPCGGVESAPVSPTPTITPRDAAWGTLDCYAAAEPTAKPVRTVKSTIRASRRTSNSSSKSRSPMKGLFPSPATPACATMTLTVPVPSSTPAPIVVPQLLGGVQSDDDEDAWVDEDDDGEGNITLRGDEDEDLLATPVAPRSWQLEDPLGGLVSYQPVKTPVSAVYSAILPPTPTPATAEAEFHVGGKRKR